MKIICVSELIPKTTAEAFVGITKGNAYDAAVVPSPMVVGHSEFLIYNDNGQWEQYPLENFKGIFRDYRQDNG